MKKIYTVRTEKIDNTIAIFKNDEKKLGYMDIHRRGTLSFWKVSNWDTGYINYEGQVGARAYARVKFHLGAEHEGNGIIIQDLNLHLRSYCNYQVRIFRNNGI